MPEDAEVVRSLHHSQTASGRVAAYIIKKIPNHHGGYSKDTEVHCLKDVSTYQDQCV
jgi:hypothetical protein